MRLRFIEVDGIQYVDTFTVIAVIELAIAKSQTRDGLIDHLLTIKDSLNEGPV